MHCRVVVEAAVPVFDVETEDEAIRIAISKTGEMLNPDLNYVEINMGERTAPSGEELPPAFIAADEALVALELEMTVFNVEREEHASRIARKEIGQLLENIPLEVISVEEFEEEDEDEDESESETDDSSNDQDGDSSADETSSTSETEAEGNTDADDDEILPEFEDLVE
ncbi:DUF555 domain-containing protein [Natronorubrum sp. JWXQ-INN-674]|uniref:UPF0212 protein GS429_10180 n=1 Tax=Natronorubrum halalkaliphilum TaxID=2691917 RepID=A0A6B0VLI5_9EURY|nr:DUF555 domain-containing protein [Natronorubrum halalkaliphilum]MXV62424.1 DUF555 domain-containing protein [Natronorubrum halalkaliphilum]